MLIYFIFALKFNCLKANQSFILKYYLNFSFISYLSNYATVILKHLTDLSFWNYADMFEGSIVQTSNSEQKKVISL